MKTTAAARLDRATCAALVAAVLMPVALGLIFFYVPNDADQGFSQRIFYFHVPIAMTTYALFAWGALNAARYLWSGDPSLDLRSYVPMHLGVIFGTLTLVTGSICSPFFAARNTKPRLMLHISTFSITSD